MGEGTESDKVLFQTAQSGRSLRGWRLSKDEIQVRKPRGAPGTALRVEGRVSAEAPRTGIQVAGREWGTEQLRSSRFILKCRSGRAAPGGPVTMYSHHQAVEKEAGGEAGKATQGDTGGQGGAGVGDHSALKV